MGIKINIDIFLPEIHEYLCRQRNDLRHRYNNFQHKDAVFTFDGALSVVFFCRAFDVGQSEAVEEGVLLGGSA